MGALCGLAAVLATVLAVELTLGVQGGKDAKPRMSANDPTCSYDALELDRVELLQRCGIDETTYQQVPVDKAPPGTKPKDWRDTPGVVRSVIQQGRCESCWALAAVGAVEAAYALQYKDLTGIDLSAQQMVSCAQVPIPIPFENRTLGCRPSPTLNQLFGTPELAYKHMRSFGIESSAVYPYDPAKADLAYPHDCHESSTNVVAKLTGRHRVNFPGREQAMYERIQHTPMAVCVDDKAFKYYHFDKTDPYNPSKRLLPTLYCTRNPLDMNHCVLVVGIEADRMEEGEFNWIIKNSWNETWGDNGYAYLRAGHNHCGIAWDVTDVLGKVEKVSHA